MERFRAFQSCLKACMYTTICTGVCTDMYACTVCVCVHTCNLHFLLSAMIASRNQTYLQAETQGTTIS